MLSPTASWAYILSRCAQAGRDLQDDLLRPSPPPGKSITACAVVKERLARLSESRLDAALVQHPLNRPCTALATTRLRVQSQPIWFAMTPATGHLEALRLSYVGQWLH